MPASADAILQDSQGRPALRFERLFDHPPDRVWLALTQPDQLHRWHPSPFELEPRVGGVVSFLPPEGNAFGDGRVTACEPPRLLAYSWGEDDLRWELEPRDGGTHLILTHTFEDRLKAARDAAGWDLCLGALAGALAGVENQPSGEGDSTIPVGWEELNRAYEKRFGIAPEQATPPPSRVIASDTHRATSDVRR